MVFQVYRYLQKMPNLEPPSLMNAHIITYKELLEKNIQMTIYIMNTSGGKNEHTKFERKLEIKRKKR